MEHIVDPRLKAWATARQAEFIDAVNRCGSQREAARQLGIDNAVICRSLKRLAKRASFSAVLAQELTPAPAAQVTGRPRRFLLTSAQDETTVHEPFFANLEAYAQAIGAELMVGGFTYQKGLFEDHATRSGVFASRVRPYLRHENEWCGPVLFAAKMNILPTAVRPLSGLETYSRGAWAVFPHAKVQAVSVPSLPGRHPAMVMTTGACTLPNYIDKKAGLKAEFHHQIGATIVEIDGSGRTFLRQIGADKVDGSFQDLDARVRDGQVTRGHRVEQITAGDLHLEKGDPVVFRAVFGYDLDARQVVTDDSMIGVLRPRSIAVHDVLDFQTRNHHRRTDPHFAVRMFARGSHLVEGEVQQTADFLEAMEGLDFMRTVVAASNHQDALARWLREADPRQEGPNFRYWCELNAEWCRAIEAGVDFDPFKFAAQRASRRGLAEVVFVPRNGSFQVCEEHGGIEVGMHGDEGPNGARGSALALTRVATRMNIGHAHTAGILDGVYTAGLCGLMDQGYNSGPSGWSHTQIVTYANARRSLVTVLDGRWRA